jgi:hypothetical protein
MRKIKVEQRREGEDHFQNASASIEAPHHCTSCTDCAPGTRCRRRSVAVEHDRFGDQLVTTFEAPLMTGLPWNVTAALALESRSQNAMPIR